MSQHLTTRPRKTGRKFTFEREITLIYIKWTLIHVDHGMRWISTLTILHRDLPNAAGQLRRTKDELRWCIRKDIERKNLV